MFKSGAELPVLIGQMGPLNGQRWLIGDSLTIGRDPACNVMIPDRQVSRYHARLISQPDGVMLEDLGSKNGTFLNGKLVNEPALLGDGDLLQVALVQNFVYLSSDATMPMDMPMPVTEQGGRLYLDIRSRRVWVNKQEVLPPLSAPQFRLLQTLYNQAGRVVSRQDLINVTWGPEESVGVTEQALDALVRRLRDRLALLDSGHAYIITVRGHGLRLDNPRE